MVRRLGLCSAVIGGLNVITANLDSRALSELGALRRLTLLSDVCGVILGLGYTVLTAGTQPQGPVLVVLFVVAASSQLRRTDEGRSESNSGSR